MLMLKLENAKVSHSKPVYNHLCYVKYFTGSDQLKVLPYRENPPPTWDFHPSPNL